MENIMLEEGTPISISVCTSCNSNAIIVEGGEIICSSCGLVLGAADASSEPEWRAFSREERERRERTGAPLSQAVHDKGLSTVIGKPDSKATKEERERANRIKKWQIRSRIHSSTDRNLIQAMSELSRLVEKLHIPSQTKERAAVIYRQALDKDLVRGRSIAAIVAASLYAACRLIEIPRTLAILAIHSSVSKKDIARCFRLIVRELDLKMPVPNSSSKVAAIAARLGLSEATQKCANMILIRAMDQKLTAGKDPMGLAAAAIYIACQLRNENKTQKAIAQAAGVTEVTIRNRYKGLKEAIKGIEDFDEQWEEFMQERTISATSSTTV